ncbi:MAG: hypothetical protein PHH13_03450 [Candidatus Peribacteraceae bacterium]|nr:hypothetical protein [Candidatus Peribacteraceae bacterium]
MISLSLLFLLLYVAIVVLIGVMTAHRETEEGFMIADRKVAGLQLAATMSAGFFDGATLSIYLAYVYQFGFSALWAFVGAALGYIVLRHFSGRAKMLADQLRCYSMPEYFGRIIGWRSGLAFSAILIFQFFLLAIVDLVVSGKILSSIFPIPYAAAVSIGGAIILSYLLLAGFKAVVRTDFFQLIIMFVMSISVGWYLMGESVIVPADFSLWNMGVGDTIGFLVVGAMNIMIAPDLWQRMFASKNERSLRTAFIYAAFFLTLLGIIISIVGLATKQHFPSIAPEDAFLVGFTRLLPYGLMQFGLVLLYAVALSSCDTITFVVSSILTRDVQTYIPHFSAQSMRRLTRWFMLAFVLLAIASGLLIQDILTLGFSFSGICLALFPAVIGSFYWKLKDRAVTGSIIIALSSLVALLLFKIPLSPETVLITLPVSLASLVVLQRALKA